MLCMNKVLNICCLKKHLSEIIFTYLHWFHRMNPSGLLFYPINYYQLFVLNLLRRENRILLLWEMSTALFPKLGEYKQFYSVYFANKHSENRFKDLTHSAYLYKKAQSFIPYIRSRRTASYYVFSKDEYFIPCIQKRPTVFKGIVRRKVGSFCTVQALILSYLFKGTPSY